MFTLAVQAFKRGKPSLADPPVIVLAAVTVFYWINLRVQCAKKVLSDSPGLVDFAIGLVNSVFNLPDGQVMFYEEFK